MAYVINKTLIINGVMHHSGSETERLALAPDLIDRLLESGKITEKTRKKRKSKEESKTSDVED